MDRNLGMDFVRATEAAALSAGRWVGKGDRHAVDQAACEAMRRALSDVDMRGVVVIGEGERDEAPMLYIGEELGTGNGYRVQIAVDPVEGTNLVANGMPGAISVVAAAIEGEGRLLHAPDIYMDKLVVGPAAKGAVDITLPPRMNLKVIAKSLGKEIQDLTVGMLDRPRHEQLIREIRSAGRAHPTGVGWRPVAGVRGIRPERRDRCANGHRGRTRRGVVRCRRALHGGRNPGATGVPQRAGA
jgi:fructose-1,6-bisphosphatase class II